MVSYKVEVVAAVGWTSGPTIAKQVQARLDAFVAGGWRLSGMTSVAGTGGLFGGSVNPYLVMVFEHD